MTSHQEITDLPPTVSVIIPTYNREAPLIKIISSLLEQDFQDFEIIIIDQTKHHDPGTASYLDENSQRILRYIQEVPSLPLARNNGLLFARGKVIIFFDDDIILPPNAVRIIAHTLISTSFDGLSVLVNFEKDSEDLWREYCKSYKLPVGFDKSEPFQVRYFIGAVMGFKREVFTKLGGFDNNLATLSPTCAGEDIEFCQRAVLSGLKIGISPAVEVYHPLGITGGCGAREINKTLAKRVQLTALIYINYKHWKLKLTGATPSIIRVVRGHIVNRKMLRDSPLRVLGNIVEGWNALLRIRRLLRSGSIDI